MRSGFFNSDIIGYDEEGMPVFDRAEEADFFAEYFGSFIGNGIFPNPSSNFQVVAASGLQLSIKPGKCWINGYFGWSEQAETVTLETGSAQDRIDRIVLQLDLRTRTVSLKVNKGIPSTTPAAPALVRPSAGQLGDIYELGIATVYITKNSSVIAQDKITDTRLITNVCGIVTQAVDKIDTSTFALQLQGWIDRYMPEKEQEFNAWMTGLQEILDESTAGNLLNLITKITDGTTMVGNALKLNGKIASELSVYNAGKLGNKIESELSVANAVKLNGKADSSFAPMIHNHNKKEIASDYFTFGVWGAMQGSGPGGSTSWGSNGYFDPMKSKLIATQNHESLGVRCIYISPYSSGFPQFVGSNTNNVIKEGEYPISFQRPLAQMIIGSAVPSAATCPIGCIYGQV